MGSRQDVFPDISPEPRFFFDDRKSIIDGNCYWITTNPGVDEDVLYLILGLCNSSLMKHYHDLAFQNRLYAGRRRYLTQYVAKYPLPMLDSQAAKKLGALAKRVIRRPSQRLDASDIEEIDSLAIEAFVAT